MHRATGSDHHKPFTLEFIEISFDIDFTVDLIEHPCLCLAILTILCINTVVVKPNLNTLQCVSFSLRIHAECDRYSGPESCKQEPIWAGALICSPKRFGLIREEVVFAGDNFLSEVFSFNGAYRYIGSHFNLL